MNVFQQLEVLSYVVLLILSILVNYLNVRCFNTDLNHMLVVNK
jgi:hypothetical protein